MKKVILSSLVAIFALAAQAQNVQLHYDFGRNIYSDEEAGRQKVTLTLEQFKADRFGSWYYFVDFDLSRKFMEAAYTEISREFNLGKGSPFAAHIEYNGGWVPPGTVILPISPRPIPYKCSTSATSRATTILTLTIACS